MSKVNFQPLGKRVLAEVNKAETKTAGGIIIPDSVEKDQPTTATIKAVSSEVTNVKEGDIVVFAPFSGSEIKIDGVKYTVLEEKEIVGVMK